MLFSRFWLDFAHHSDYYVLIFLNLKILHIVLIIGYVLFFKTQNFALRADHYITLFIWNCSVIVTHVQVQGVWCLQKQPLSTRPKVKGWKTRKFSHRVDYWIRVVFWKLKILYIVLIIWYVLFFKNPKFGASCWLLHHSFYSIL